MADVSETFWPVPIVADSSAAQRGRHWEWRARAEGLFAGLTGLETEERITVINAIRQELHKWSPMKDEPVDCVLWIKAEDVRANDYNPNTVAPPEMKLLEHSIREDGYTQPVVTWRDGAFYEVVDGFHRHRIGLEAADIKDRIHGYLPVTVVNDTRLDRGDRIAATIRHNRARGKHRIDAMAEIVLELKRRNWSEKKIGAELGMDPDEVLRLAQITGLAEMFADHKFSEAWEADLGAVISEEDNLEDATAPLTPWDTSAMVGGNELMERRNG